MDCRHIRETIINCAQTIYALRLRVLRCYGLPDDDALQTVYRAVVVVAKLLRYMPAVHGAASSQLVIGNELTVFAQRIYSPLTI